jgi:hypothetical protein
MEVFVQLSSLQNEEMEYRRFLYKLAADGDVRAQEKLEREYHVRVRPKDIPRQKTSRVESRKA